MVYQSLDIAKYIVEYAKEKGQRIAVSKLMKIMYYIQAQGLVYNHEPFFEDEIYAEENGPKISFIYEYYNKRFPGSFIELNDIYIKKYGAVSESISEDDKQIINAILDQTLGFTNQFIGEVIKKQKPFIDALQSEGKIITKDSLKEYFGTS